MPLPKCHTQSFGNFLAAESKPCSPPSFQHSHQQYDCMQVPTRTNKPFPKHSPEIVCSIWSLAPLIFSCSPRIRSMYAFLQSCISLPTQTDKLRANASPESLWHLIASSIFSALSPTIRLPYTTPRLPIAAPQSYG